MRTLSDNHPSRLGAQLEYLKQHGSCYKNVQLRPQQVPYLSHPVVKGTLRLHCGQEDAVSRGGNRDAAPETQPGQARPPIQSHLQDSNRFHTHFRRQLQAANDPQRRKIKNRKHRP